MRAEDEYPIPELGGAPPPSDVALVPPGNAFRAKGLIPLLLGAAALLLLSIVNVRLSFGLPLGLVALGVTSFGVLDALGCFDDASAPAASVPLRALALPGAALALSVVAQVVVLRLAVAGVLPRPILSAALLCPAAGLGVLASIAWVLQRLGASDRPWFARHGFWLMAIAIALYVPMLGSYSLIDPWETHYGEVAREMLARDDWISLWWAQEGWFFSKPILNFWLQGLAFLLLGVRFAPDQMLAGVEDGRFPQPEWAARAPVMVFTAIAIYLAYRAVAKVHGRRAGLLSGLVLTTTPYWFFVAHQSMTDMPYVAPLTGALALIALGLRADPDELLPSFELRVGARGLRLSLAHLLFALVIATALPQIFYLVSRNLSLYVDGVDRGVNVHGDSFFAGSGGGNCGLPGNEPCRSELPLSPLFQPALGALLWSIALGLFLFANRGERRTARICFLGAWYLTALAFLAKGAPGIVLPLLVSIAAVCSARRYRDLARLELPGFALLLACVALPWYVQAFVRHGAAFTDRLLFHDMYKRAFVHVHDTNTGDDVSFSYYLWQLGYGLFPWTGLAAVGLVFWLRERDEAESSKSAFGALLGLWVVLGFSMFTVSLTKFHHYALPVAPPLCLLTGIVLDRVLGARPRTELGRSTTELTRAALYYAGVTIAALALVCGAACFHPGSFLGTVVDWIPVPPAAPAFGAVLGITGLALFAFSVWRFGAPRAPDAETSAFESAGFALLGVVAAGFVALAGRDLYSDGSVDGDARLMHLFVYDYRRAWPASLDFSAMFRAFSVVASSACALFALPRLRAHGARLLIATAAIFTVFALDVYLVKAAPHWGQRETVLAYYATRAGADEPLVAFQMNWKGENFYTGNRIPAFVTTGEQFQEYIAKQRERGVRVMYFTTEHRRVSTLKNELGEVKSFSVLTTPELNNKFMLARVEL